MKHISKLIYPTLISALTIVSLLYPNKTLAQNSPIPEILLSCNETRQNEFHSLRPYQAAPCGDAPKALFCSNKLVIFETFDLSSYCDDQKLDCTDCEWDCKPNPVFEVDAHDLNITLDESEFPILGNTQDEFDDATKMNEYASWYLNGVIDKKENKDATEEQVVNFSGPVKKLLPSMIQDAQRIKIINTPNKIGTQVGGESLPQLELDDDFSNQADNHDQLVVDNERLTDWLGDLSFLRSAGNTLNNISNGIMGAALGGVVIQGLNSVGVSLGFDDAWNKRYPPLPWSDENGQPFNSEVEYRKAYAEWQGKSCAIILGTLLCIDNPLITNKYADLWHYVPLSNNSDKRGKNYLLTSDGPSYVPSVGTVIANDQHVTYSNAPLYFAHTQEVYDLSNLLNTTYQPGGYESEDLPQSTEQIKKGVLTASPKPGDALASRDPYSTLDCSAVNVRVNEGDDLFPGDRPSGKEIFVEGAEYDIIQVKCHETNREEWKENGCINPRTNEKIGCYVPVNKLECTGQVGIEFKLGTQTPYADEIFSQTVAGSGATFRKIFPKVEEGAPVECIADIPTATNVTYSIENSLNQVPPGGKQELKQTIYPADGANSGTQLTFAHIGSVYEYFLNGIQTALRPKGYGSPIANGNCKPTEPIECGEWEEKLEKSSGGDCGVCTSELGDLAKRILATAGKQYNVPAASIWAAMKHEGGDWDEFRGQFTDENVRKWSTPLECGGEPMPSCNPGDTSSSKAYPPFGHLPYWFYRGDEDDGLWAAVQQFDPTRNSPEAVSHCNFLDAAFASAKNLATWSGYARTPPFCYNFNLGMSDRPGSCGDWEDYNIVQSHVGYWIGTTPWCPDGTGGESPLVNNIPIPDYASRVLSDFKSAKCN